MHPYLKHLRVSSTIRKLIRNTRIEQELYWHDLKLKEALGWKGIIKFLSYRLAAAKVDEIAKNYNVDRLYFGEPLNDGLSTSGATVWNYTRLQNAPIIDENEITRLLEANAGVFIREYKANIDKIAAHPDNNTLASEGSWSGIFLYGVNGEKDPRYIDYFQQTYQILDRLPISKSFGFVMISKLSGGTRISPHCGSSNLRFRYHLGLEVPEPDKAKIRVGKEWKHWQTGKAYGFDDSFEHEVIHDGEKDRVVLIVDTWNPDLTPEEISILENSAFKNFGTR